MSEGTRIQWTDASLSPWEGCTKVSPGCKHCYAEARDRRFHGGAHWGPGAQRRRVKSFEAKARALNKRAVRECVRFRVFPSICDWLDPEVPVEWLADFLRVVSMTRFLDWQLLTKRPELFWERVDLAGRRRWLGGAEVPENVWVGVSVENQALAEERLPELCEIPAAVRFVSAEPLLGPVGLMDWMAPNLVNSVDWVIVGGESGPGARVCDLTWAISLVRQCEAAGVPCFVKQLGSNVVEFGSEYVLADSKGGNLEEWRADLRVREMPGSERRTARCGRI